MSGRIEDLIEAPGSVPIIGAFMADPAPGHAPWPHKHVSPEGQLIKAIWITAVLAGAGVYGLLSAWRSWRRKHRAALERKVLERKRAERRQRKRRAS